MRPDGTFLTKVQCAAQKEKKVETDIHLFRIDIPQADLDDLQERLARTRRPDELRPMTASKVGRDLGLRRRVLARRSVLRILSSLPASVAVRGPVALRESLVVGAYTNSL